MFFVSVVHRKILWLWLYTYSNELKNITFGILNLNVNFQTLKGLTEEEDRQCDQILQQIREQVQRRRLMIYPYFKDHDRVS